VTYRPNYSLRIGYASYGHGGTHPGLLFGVVLGDERDQMIWGRRNMEYVPRNTSTLLLASVSKRLPVSMYAAEGHTTARRQSYMYL
jgi:hypothetical protein